VTSERLKVLDARRARIEDELRLYYPSIANGDSLFQEYHSVDFQRPGHERYQRTLRDIQRLQGRLQANTKFDRLVRWGAANLFWVVADPDIIAGHELPAGWGLLVHQGGSLEVAVKPLLHEVSESDRLALFHRIALAGSRAVNREHTSAAGSDMAYIVNSAAIEQTFQNGLNADSANWQALMEANANPDTRGDADSALGFNNGRGPAVSPEEAASGLAWVQQTEKALATTLMEPEPQFQQWWNQELAEAASMPAGNAALQALTSVRSRAQALIVEDAMFEAGMALEQNNQTQFQSIINPSTGRPFTYTQTANGLQVASSLTLGGKPMTLSFPAPAR